MDAAAMLYAMFAAIAALAIAVVAMYRRYRRVLSVCKREHGGVARREKRTDEATAADLHRRKAQGSDNTAAPAEAGVGSSGTFADLCTDGDDAPGNGERT